MVTLTNAKLDTIQLGYAQTLVHQDNTLKIMYAQLVPILLIMSMYVTPTMDYGAMQIPLSKMINVLLNAKLTLMDKLLLGMVVHVFVLLYTRNLDLELVQHVQNVIKPIKKYPLMDKNVSVQMVTMIMAQNA